MVDVAPGTTTAGSASGHILVWTNWAGGTGSTVYTDSSITNTIWTQWTTTSSATTTTLHSITTNGQTYAWNEWNRRYETIGSLQVATAEQTRSFSRPVSDAERERWRKQEAEYKRKLEEEVALRKNAEARAEEILLEHLSAEQREDLRKKSSFFLEAIGNDGARRKYRIDRGTHGNVKLMDDEGKKVVGSYCVQPKDVPVADAMLAQVLWLRNNEEGFKKAANFRAW